MNPRPDKKHRMALIGLAMGSFIVGTRVLYVFKESQKDNLIINSTIGVFGLVIALVSVLYMYKRDN